MRYPSGRVERQRFIRPLDVIEIVRMLGLIESRDALRISSYLRAHAGQYLEELRVLCAIDSPSGDARGINEMCSAVEAWCQDREWTVVRRRDDEAGDSLCINVVGSGRGLRGLLAVHLDTVYARGVALERPLLIDGNILRGPGVADNKSGLLSSLYALAALSDLGLLTELETLTLVCGADEETDMRTSLPLLHEVARNCHMALVLEAGRENGDIVDARKTSAHFELDVWGHEAHAGVEPDKGANAIVAIAHHIVELHALHGSRAGLTVNVGVVGGGTRVNVVPGHARVEIDVRAVQDADTEPVTREIERIVATQHIPGTTSRLSGGWKAPAMHRTHEIAKLASLATTCAHELGFALAAAATGGVSYANHLAGMGLPVLDGLGPVGGLDHSPDEYIDASSIVPRTALTALLLLRSAELRGRQ